VSDADVVAFEQRLGHVLPDDYRRFILDVNGGVPAPEHMRFERWAVRERVWLFCDQVS
jgi:hypothetical protein